ncbi:MAG: hypothetical protein QM689_10465 [Oscillospiraceae bacterium]
MRDNAVIKFISKRKVRLIIGVILLMLLTIGFLIFRTFTTVPKLFKLNNELASEGYYTAQFEFKMLTYSYELDNGDYIKAFKGINQLYSDMKNKENLIKIPDFQTKEDEYEFYLNLQNPKTGAFMDDSYPIFTYFEPTINVIEKLKNLSDELGRPLELKYPLNFLDELDTPDELNQYLDSLSTVGWIGTKFKTPYILAAKLTGYKRLEELNLYSFSDEWENAMAEWFYNNQDSETGMWGPKLRSNGELYDSGDLGCTYAIIQNLFLDENGQTLNAQFPLRYTNEIFTSALNRISEPMPDDANLDETHDWTIRNYQGIKLLTHYLWKTASDENKNKARECIASIVTSDFEHTYVESDGAFSLYPDTGKADLDGTSTMFHLLSVIGAFDQTTQTSIWGDPITDEGTTETGAMTQSSLDSLLSDGVNSIRVYTKESADYLKNASMVYYPKSPAVLDAADFLPRLITWIHTTDLSLGTWASQEALETELSEFDITQPVIVTDTIPVDQLNELLKSSGSLYIVGFDELQIPQYKMVIKHRT